MYDAIWASALVIAVGAYVFFKREIYLPFGILAYGFVRAAIYWSARLYKSIVKVKRPSGFQIERRPIPTTVTQSAAMYNIKPGEVVLGLKSRKAIKVKIDDGHTLISGITRNGKSVSIHGMLAQLFSLGSAFIDKYDVYIIDLKGNPMDGFTRWRPLLAGFAAIGSKRDLSEVKALLEHLDDMVNQAVDKRILLFIDEVAFLDKRGMDLLFNLVSQMAVNGSVIAATQTAQYKVISTIARNNFERRIAFRVADVEHARLALGIRPHVRQLPKQKGEFMLVEPGENHIVTGRTIYINPNGDEIKRVVRSALEAKSQGDPRLKLFIDVAGNLNVGGSLPGVSRVNKMIDYMGLGDIVTAYRNFDACGVTSYTTPGKKGGRRKLEMEFGEAFLVLADYINNGRWQSAPDSVVK